MGEQPEREQVTVLGAGSWGTALALHLAGRGHRVWLWARRRELAQQLQLDRENKRYLAGVPLPEQITATDNLPRALAGSRVVLFCVPSHGFRETLRSALPYFDPQTIVVNTAKGLEEQTMLRMSQVYEQETREEQLGSYAMLSGPSHAEEVALKMPTAVVVASVSHRTATRVQDLCMDENLRVYTNHDVIGVEMGGALKNIIALGTGIVDGLHGGDNTKAALMTRGLAEITRLGVTMQANPLTFAGLTGLGDLIVTCTSRHSRNRRAGVAIGQGQTLAQTLATVGMVVEGVRTTKAAYELARHKGVEMPITEQMYQVLFQGLDPARAVKNLMCRDKTPEMQGSSLIQTRCTVTEK